MNWVDIAFMAFGCGGRFVAGMIVIITRQRRPKPVKAISDAIAAADAQGAEIRRRAKGAHIACVAQRSNGQWGTYCLACSDEAGDYVFPCKAHPENPHWPAAILCEIDTD